MKKLVMKRAFPGIIALIVAFGVMFSPQLSNVYAGYFKFVKFKKNLTVSTVDEYVLLDVSKVIKNRTNAKVSSSKKSVATIANSDGDISIKVKKPGTTKLTIKEKKGKKHTCNFKVVKYSSAFKSFKIGKKNVAGKFKKENWGYYSNTMTEPTKVKVKIVPKKNWTVKKITYEASCSEDVFDENGEVKDTIDKSIKKRTIKNNSQITIQDKSWENRIEVKMYNKKTHLTEMYFLTF